MRKAMLAFALIAQAVQLNRDGLGDANFFTMLGSTGPDTVAWLQRP